MFFLGCFQKFDLEYHGQAAKEKKLQIFYRLLQQRFNNNNKQKSIADSGLLLLSVVSAKRICRGPKPTSSCNTWAVVRWNDRRQAEPQAGFVHRPFGSQVLGLPPSNWSSYKARRSCMMAYAWPVAPHAGTPGLRPVQNKPNTAIPIHVPVKY